MFRLKFSYTALVMILVVTALIWGQKYQKFFDDLPGPYKKRVFLINLCVVAPLCLFWLWKHPFAGYTGPDMLPSASINIPFYFLFLVPFLWQLLKTYKTQIDEKLGRFKRPLRIVLCEVLVFGSMLLFLSNVSINFL